MTVSNSSAQLAWEARFARAAAVCAFASALLSLAGFILTRPIGETPVDQAVALAERSTYLLGASLLAVGFALLAPVLFYVQRAVAARRAQLSAVALGLSVLGPIAIAAATIAFWLVIVDAAGEYLAAGSPTDEGAEEALVSAQSTVVQALRLGGGLTFAMALVVVGTNALRTGLFSRFLGILAIAIGVLTVVPILGAPIALQAAWAGVLGVLFLNRWPGGRGPAWERVEAIPWPTAAQRMEEQQRARAEAEGRLPPQEANGSGTPAAELGPRPTSRKRRRGRDAE